MFSSKWPKNPTFFSQNSNKMQNNIQIFKNEMFGEIRTMTNENGETFFVGKDVAQALGYSDTQKSIRMHVDDDDKLTRQIVRSGQRRKVIKKLIK